MVYGTGNHYIYIYVYVNIDGYTYTHTHPHHAPKQTELHHGLRPLAGDLAFSNMRAVAASANSPESTIWLHQGLYGLGSPYPGAPNSPK